jgi:hypothetical protein
MFFGGITFPQNFGVKGVLMGALSRSPVKEE